MPLKGASLGYRYSKNEWLFREKNILVEPGEVVGLFGPSGCGKSTLGKLLSGHMSTQEGRVLIGGRSLADRTFNPVQLVLQHPEHAVNPKWRMRSTLAEAGEINPTLLDELCVEQEWLDRYPHELSGGELQRICIARALGRDTRYLIADEMTTMLDAITQAQIWQAVLRWAQANQAGILVISHDRNLLEKICFKVEEWTTD
ncbi:ABC transporter ATP-binding protein [Paenibacillus whitsoniae]|uniref:ATP-binding cassette domain-containing protein n=1 Tax=Paenibacillus whitsoniae TaxID=2496558 RepID=A0A430J9J7_9BACL|nr:ATP-binding cassette domain-containing protein [Paenibacillus whitsoniae]RTE07184.1 ATP-binding cassette domain-containing protein [Paenibacillus whitsoniae]